jgi:hypothetical protein
LGAFSTRKANLESGEQYNKVNALLRDTAKFFESCFRVTVQLDWLVHEAVHFPSGEALPVAARVSSRPCGAGSTTGIEISLKAFPAVVSMYDNRSPFWYPMTMWSVC